MKGCRVLRLSSVRFTVLLGLLLLLTCEAEFISMTLSVCNDLPEYFSRMIILVCGNKLKVRIYHDICGNWNIKDVAPDEELVCSLYGNKYIPWKTPTFAVRVGNGHPYPAAGHGTSTENSNHQEQQNDSLKQEECHYRLKQDGVYVKNNGRDELLEHWQWKWPSRYDVYIHNKGKTWVTVTSKTGRSERQRKNLAPGGRPMFLKLKMAADVHRGARCTVYWSGNSNMNGDTYAFYAFDLAAVRDNIFFFHDGLRGILHWYLKEEGFSLWDDERKSEEELHPWRRLKQNKKSKRSKWNRNHGYNRNRNGNYGYNHNWNGNYGNNYD